MSPKEKRVGCEQITKRSEVQEPFAIHTSSNYSAMKVRTMLASLNEMGSLKLASGILRSVSYRVKSMGASLHSKPVLHQVAYYSVWYAGLA